MGYDILITGDAWSLVLLKALSAGYVIYSDLETSMVLTKTRIVTTNNVVTLISW